MQRELTVEARTLNKEIQKTILISQRNEITEHIIYKRLSELVKNHVNRDLLLGLAKDELKHYDFWKNYTQKDVPPYKAKIWKYLLVSKLLGITFGIRLMERDEEEIQITYQKISQFIPAAKEILEDENQHEQQLINLLSEERLQYIGSIVLGLNDALVELTGALAGLTFVFQNARLVAIAGLITGVAASLSMAASEYMSIKSEEKGQSPVKAALYTGSAYVLTVLWLIFPYLLLSNVYLALGITVLNALVVIFLFTLYVSVVRNLSFHKRFLEMAVISLGVAALTFGIGILIREFLNIQI